MSAQAKTAKGQCLCGDVRFTVALKNTHLDACHCSYCRAWCGGGPFLGVSCAEPPVFESEEAVGVYSSSEWGERVFCKNCGSTLFWRMKDGSSVSASAGVLDLGNEADLTLQIFVDEKPAYYKFANKTKMMTGAEVFAQFAGGQEG
ncbi:MAG: GFA family protein [Oceanicaulis sp.]|uniref:GFA family protein n=1 Tax=Glycocaulis sp. TaxID=1969725 RepID=UPI0025BC7401|nr:GFA family protein [Glycocaulis sp.]MCC5982465.1 GFA family protein [Oceanicaulis sp.]MCH8521344.1 GFA family protein [Glycocaulis sp.]